MSYRYEIVFTAQNYTSNAMTMMSGDAGNLSMKLNDVANSADRVTTSMRSLHPELGRGGFNVSLYGAKAQDATRETNMMAMSLRGLIFGLQMTAFSLTMITSYMMSMESAQLSIEGAQERYNEALKEHGRNSKEARDAYRSLEQANLNYQRSLTMSNIMTVSMGLQFVSLAISAYQSLPAIEKLTRTLRTYNVVAAISKAMTPWGIVALAGGIAIGGAAVYAMNQMEKSASTGSVNVKVDSYNDGLITEFNRRFGSNQTKSTAMVP